MMFLLLLFLLFNSVISMKTVDGVTTIESENCYLPIKNTNIKASPRLCIKSNDDKFGGEYDPEGPQKLRIGLNNDLNIYGVSLSHTFGIVSNGTNTRTKVYVDDIDCDMDKDSFDQFSELMKQCGTTTLRANIEFLGGFQNDSYEIITRGEDVFDCKAELNIYYNTGNENGMDGTIIIRTFGQNSQVYSYNISNITLNVVKSVSFDRGVQAKHVAVSRITNGIFEKMMRRQTTKYLKVPDKLQYKQTTHDLTKFRSPRSVTTTGEANIMYNPSLSETLLNGEPVNIIVGGTSVKSGINPNLFISEVEIIKDNAILKATVKYSRDLSLIITNYTSPINMTEIKDYKNNITYKICSKGKCEGYHLNEEFPTVSFSYINESGTNEITLIEFTFSNSNADYRILSYQNATANDFDYTSFSCPKPKCKKEYNVYLLMPKNCKDKDYFEMILNITKNLYNNEDNISIYDVSYTGMKSYPVRSILTVSSISVLESFYFHNYDFNEGSGIYNVIENTVNITDIIKSFDSLIKNEHNKYIDHNKDNITIGLFYTNMTLFYDEYVSEFMKTNNMKYIFLYDSEDVKYNRDDDEFKKITTYGSLKTSFDINDLTNVTSQVIDITPVVDTIQQLIPGRNCTFDYKDDCDSGCLGFCGCNKECHCPDCVKYDESCIDVKCETDKTNSTGCVIKDVVCQSSECFNVNMNNNTIGCCEYTKACNACQEQRDINGTCHCVNKHTITCNACQEQQDINGTCQCVAKNCSSSDSCYIGLCNSITGKCDTNPNNTFIKYCKDMYDSINSYGICENSKCVKVDINTSPCKKNPSFVSECKSRSNACETYDCEDSNGEAVCVKNWEMSVSSDPCLNQHCDPIKGLISNPVKQYYKDCYLYQCNNRNYKRIYSCNEHSRCFNYNCINNTCVGSPKCPEYEMVNGVINKCRILKYCDEVRGCIYKNVEDTDGECVESSKYTVSIFPIVSSILLGIVMLLILLCIIL